METSSFQPEFDYTDPFTATAFAAQKALQMVSCEGKNVPLPLAIKLRGVIQKILMELSQYLSSSYVKHGRITDFDVPAPPESSSSFSALKAAVKEMECYREKEWAGARAREKEREGNAKKQREIEETHRKSETERKNLRRTYLETTSAGASNSCSCAPCFLNKMNSKIGHVQAMACIGAGPKVATEIEDKERRMQVPARVLDKIGHADLSTVRLGEGCPEAARDGIENPKMSVHGNGSNSQVVTTQPLKGEECHLGILDDRGVGERERTEPDECFDLYQSQGEQVFEVCPAISLVEENNFRKALCELEQQVESLRKWNRLMSNQRGLSGVTVQLSEEEWQTVAEKLCLQLKNSTQALDHIVEKSCAIDKIGTDCRSTVTEEGEKQNLQVAHILECNSSRPSASTNSVDLLSYSTNSQRSHAVNNGEASLGESSSDGSAYPTAAAVLEPSQIPAQCKELRCIASQMVSKSKTQSLGRSSNFGCREGAGKSMASGLSRMDSGTGIGPHGKREVQVLGLDSKLLTRGTRNQPYRNSDGTWIRPERTATQK